MNKYILIAASCMIFSHTIYAQPESYTYLINTVKITLTLGTPKKQTAANLLIPLNDPFNTHSINLILSAITHSACNTTEPTTQTVPYEFRNLLHDVFSEHVSITTVPALTKQICFNPLHTPSVCTCELPPLQEIHVTVANEQLFYTYTKRLMIIYELWPKIDAFTAHYAQKYRDDADRQDLYRFITTMQQVKRNMTSKK